MVVFVGDVDDGSQITAANHRFADTLNLGRHTLQQRMADADVDSLCASIYFQCLDGNRNTHADLETLGGIFDILECRQCAGTHAHFNAKSLDDDIAGTTGQNAGGSGAADLDTSLRSGAEEVAILQLSQSIGARTNGKRNASAEIIGEVTDIAGDEGNDSAEHAVGLALVANGLLFVAQTIHILHQAVLEEIFGDEHDTHGIALCNNLDAIAHGLDSNDLCIQNAMLTDSTTHFVFIGSLNHIGHLCFNQVVAGIDITAQFGKTALRSSFCVLLGSIFVSSLSLSITVFFIGSGVGGNEIRIGSNLFGSIGESGLFVNGGFDSSLSHFGSIQIHSIFHDKLYLSVNRNLYTLPCGDGNNKRKRPYPKNG